jgi:imidazolonepropionase-like amidohydrolase
MRTDQRMARTLARVVIAAFLLPSYWAQVPAQTQSAVPALPSNIPSNAALYSVLLMGNPAGQQAVWTAPDGSHHIFFQFNDRGRGPELTSVLQLDPKGIPVSESVTGHDYLKSPVHESYSRASGVAHWKSEYETGEKTVTGPAMYLALNSTPAEIGLLAQVALDNGDTAALLPEGEAKISRLGQLSLSAGGQQKHVALYAITGLNFAPTYLWLDERHDFFAAVDDGSTIIPHGWETTVKTLQEMQDKATHARAAELAAKLAHRAPQGRVFAHANLFDTASAQLLKDQSVVISGNRIQSAGPSAQIVAPAGAKVIDATGKTLLPGLWDMHAHVGDNDGMLNLAAGVTTVRDLGNDIESLLARRKRIEAGTEIGTRIVLAGLIDGPGPFQGPTKVLVSTPQQARAAVDNYARLGYVQIKIYSSVKPDLVPVIIAEAHQHGLRVSGHIPAGMTAAQCVELGYDEIQHANFLMLNFMPDVKNTNSTSRFTEVAKRGANLDLNSPDFESFVKLLQDHHTILDPTLSIFEEMFDARAGQVPVGYQPAAQRMPLQVRRGLLTTGLTPPPGMEQRYRASFSKMVQLVGAMYRAGIPIEAGTDTMAGFALHREFELDVQAGIPPNKVLQNATINAARIMKLDKDLGSITPGKLADLTVVDGDPVARISDIRKTALVVKNGVLYKPQELYAALGVAP